MITRVERLLEGIKNDDFVTARSAEKTIWATDEEIMISNPPPHLDGVCRESGKPLACAVWIQDCTCAAWVVIDKTTDTFIQLPTDARGNIIEKK